MEQRISFYLIFFLATIMLQIVVLNLLIATMSDAYERVYENKHGFNSDVFFSLMSNYRNGMNIFVNEPRKHKKFLYVMYPTN